MTTTRTKDKSNMCLGVNLFKSMTFRAHTFPLSGCEAILGGGLTIGKHPVVHMVGA